MKNLKNTIENAIKLKSIKDRLDQLSIDTRISQAFSRAAATASTRTIDPSNPLSWQFSGFSQHGEDGIIDYLTEHLLGSNRFFVEIGAANGLENCSAWLAFARSYRGLMIDGNADHVRHCDKALAGKIWNVRAIHSMVTNDNIPDIMNKCPFTDPDIFILDIDGMDYYIMKKIVEMGSRPKIIVVEYNSAFGPEKSITIPYEPEFSRFAGHASGFYYGVSITGWRNVLKQFGYRFLTVESSGTNAFFIKQTAFPDGFTSTVKGIDFLENTSDGSCSLPPIADSSKKPQRWSWVQQFRLIQDLPFETI